MPPEMKKQLCLLESISLNTIDHNFLYSLTKHASIFVCFVPGSVDIAEIVGPSGRACFCYMRAD